MWIEKLREVRKREEEETRQIEIGRQWEIEEEEETRQIEIGRQWEIEEEEETSTNSWENIE